MPIWASIKLFEDTEKAKALIRHQSTSFFIPDGTPAKVVYWKLTPLIFSAARPQKGSCEL